MLPETGFDLDNFLSGQEKTTEQNTTLGLVPKFDFKTNRLVIIGGRTVYCTEIEAIEQWIEMCVRTPSDKYKIYEDTYFGNSTVLNLINKKSLPSDFTKSEVIQDLTERILRHKLIDSVENFDIKNSDGEAVVSFKVNTKNGTIPKEVVIVV